MEEKEAIIRLKKGDQEAFSFLYKRYWERVYRFTNLYVASAHVSEEIVQEVFVRLWEHRGQLDEEKNFDGFLFIITRNLIFNHSRDAFNAAAYQATVLEAMEDCYSIEEELDAADLKDYISSVISLLSPRQQQVFRLSREQHLSYSEIAQKLQISVKTVERHINEALKFLRRNLRLYSVFLMMM